MKTRLFLLLLVPAVAAGQTRPSLQLGLDVAKLLLTATNGRPVFRQAVLIEPTINVPLNDRRTLTI